MGSQIRDLRALIIELQADIKALKADNSKAEVKNEFDYEEVLEEINERSRRKRNLMVFDVPETGTGGSSAGPSTNDIEMVREIIQTLDPQFQVQNIKPMRLGRQVAGKTRPIKLVLGDENEVLRLIRGAGRLKESRLKNVRVSVDQTPRQIAHFKKLREEVAGRNAGGDQKFRIRYFNGVPKIVNCLN